MVLNKILIVLDYHVLLAVVLRSAFGCRCLFPLGAFIWIYAVVMVVEAETPILSFSAGGAAAESFVTRSKALGSTADALHLRIAHPRVAHLRLALLRVALTSAL